MLPVIVSNELSRDHEEKLLQVVRKYKKTIDWTIVDIKGINPTFCSHKIILEEKYILKIQPQRRLNPTMKEVVKKEVLKLLDAGIIFSYL